MGGFSKGRGYTNGHTRNHPPDSVLQLPVPTLWPSSATKKTTCERVIWLSYLPTHFRMKSSAPIGEV
jgi:hypothetical protein